MKYENLLQIFEDYDFKERLMNLAGMTQKKGNEFVFSAHSDMHLRDLTVNQSKEGEEEGVEDTIYNTGQALHTPNKGYNLLWVHSHPNMLFYHPSHGDLDCHEEIIRRNMVKYVSTLHLMNMAGDTIPENYWDRKFNPVGVIVVNPEKAHEFNGIVFQKVGDKTLRDYMCHILDSDDVCVRDFERKIETFTYSLDKTIQAMEDSGMYIASPLHVRKGRIQTEGRGYERFRLV
ncbi:hypothetical protein C0585_07195 [Candidatus Woesearchaeota archaeon]|nr:MAG: hypothetical protein C0585_07195 [Candidatus Woesearchaeota archaeon]